MYEAKPNTGVLFKAEKKSDKHPDYTGNLKMEDGEYLLSAWVKEGKRGKFFSISVKKKDVKTSGNQDDLPF